MSKQIHVAVSPLSNRIYAGYVLKDGQTWSETNRTDVTGEACAAVAMHALIKGGEIVITNNGKPEWEIAVKRVSRIEGGSSD